MEEVRTPNTPPHSIEAERSILGSMLLFPYSLYGLCLMGLADRLIGIRRRVGKSK